MCRCPEALSFVPRGSIGAVHTIMKMLPGYLEKADEFAKMAALEKDAWLKAELEKQAAAYRKVASQRAKKTQLRSPSPNPVIFFLAGWR